jgi:spectinomycin phosphotransferase
VPTHGRPHGSHVLATAGGLRLADWATLAVAPPERDLQHVLVDADGEDPELAYLASGGVPRAMSPDLLELFALERHLSEVADSAVRLAAAHPGSADDERCLEDLDTELDALRDLARAWG